jgi:hypothetical protein
MNDNNYSTPQSNLNIDGTDLDELLEPLRATRPWARLCSIVGFVMAAFQVVGGIVGLIGGLAGGAAGAGVSLGVFYLLFAFLTFFPSLFLFKYASSIRSAERSMEIEDVRLALMSQKSFWRFMGILTLVYLVILAVGLLALVVGGIGAAML